MFHAKNLALRQIADYAEDASIPAQTIQIEENQESSEHFTVNQDLVIRRTGRYFGRFLLFGSSAGELPPSIPGADSLLANGSTQKLN